MPDKKFAIVGIDPGATIAVSILDLSGGKIHSSSFKNEGIAEAVRVIEAHCTPSLVACDTNPAPDAAQRIASYFSCRLFSPRQNIREEEKRQVARGAGMENVHERDAYCAAVFAYRASANRLRQIDALDGLGEQEKERVKHLLLRGYRVQDAFLLLKEPVQEGRQERKAVAPAKAAAPEELRLRLESLARENANLRLALARLEEEKAALIHKLRLMENGARQSFMRDSEYRKLRFQLQQSLSRLASRRRKGRGQPPAPQASQRQDQAKKGQKGTSAHEEINSLVEPNLDLERLVEEYRKGRKT